jgi:hypothetical protein
MCGVGRGKNCLSERDVAVAGLMACCKGGEGAKHRLQGEGSDTQVAHDRFARDMGVLRRGRVCAHSADARGFSSSRPHRMAWLADAARVFMYQGLTDCRPTSGD